MLTHADFVISFKESDRAWAELIAQVLGEAGYQAELLSWAYKASRDMLAEVARLGREGTIFIPVLTPAYMTTLHAEHYWFEAFREGLFPVLPVLARECDIDALLFVHSYVDIRDCTVDEARARVVGEAYKLKAPSSGKPVRKAPPASSVVTGVRIADLTPLRRVPFERAQPYVGGEPLLQGMHAALREHHLAVLLPHESGLGGFGRRKACIEYLYQFEAEYRLIWVIRANRAAVLAEDFARLAEVVQLPEAGQRDLPYTAHAVRRWLSSNPGWLLLFYDPPNFNAVASYLPALSEGHVLVSAGSGSWHEAKAVFHVSGWNQNQVQEYLRRIRGSEAASARVASLLSSYPLALSITAATAKQAGWTSQRLLELLTARATALETVTASMNPQRAALAVALSLALSELWQHTPECVDLLRALVYLDSFNVLPGMLVCGVDALPAELAPVLRDHHKTEQAILHLRQAGLIEERFGSITIFPLVQEQLRQWMEQSTRGAIHAVHPQLSETRSFSLARAEGPHWARHIIRMLLHIFPARADFEQKWTQAAKLVSHSYAALEHGARLGVDRAECEQLWTRLGEFLLYREMLDPAAVALEQAMTLDKQPHIGGREERYQLLRALGQVRSYQGRVEEACTHLDAGVKAAIQAHGRKSPEVSEMLIMLGNAWRKAGDPARARDAYEQAYEIDQQLHAGPHADVVRDLMMLGIAQQELDDWAAAWSILEKALGMQGIVHGPNHISLAQVSKCLARVYHAMGDLPQAQLYFKQSIQVTESLHGNGHPALADIYEGYGDVLYALRDIDAARRAYKCAFRIVEAVYGMHDRRLFDCALKLGDTALARNEPEKALQAYERALSLLKNGACAEAELGRVQARITQARQLLVRTTPIPH
jgi:tetratricopeptide (TPR) repeat protein